MGANHNDAFRGHLDRLMVELDPDLLRQSLFSKKVISRETMDSFAPQEGVHSRKDRLRRLLKLVESRGNVPQLAQSLAETGHVHLATLLGRDRIANGNTALAGGRGDAEEGEQPETTRCHPTNLPNASPEFVTRIRGAANAHGPRSLINVGTQPRSFTVQLATERLDRSYRPDLHVYPMGSNPKGLMLLINNINFENGVHVHRKGAEVDEHNLTFLYEQLGFEVIKHQNLAVADMKKTIVAFAKNPRLNGACALTVGLMSHGQEMDYRTVTIGHDGLRLDIEWVVRQFDSENCPAMVAKPKMFLFQMCRGGEKDLGVAAKHVSQRRTATDGFPSDKQHLRASGDILIAHSTLPGYVSNRDTHLGTWYIQAVCEIFSERACDTDLEDMLKMVDSRLSRLICEEGSMQASSYENRGFRKFFFVPGLYDNPGKPAKPNMVSRGTQSPCQPVADATVSARNGIGASVDLHVETDFDMAQFGPEIDDIASTQPVSQGSQPNTSDLSQNNLPGSQSSCTKMSQGSQPNMSDLSQNNLPGSQPSWTKMSQGSQPNTSDLSQNHLSGSQSSWTKMSQGSQPTASKVARHDVSVSQSSRTEQRMSQESQSNMSIINRQEISSQSLWRSSQEIPLDPLDAELHWA